MSVDLGHEITADRRRQIEEILESEIGEVSAVDNPATDRPFRLFKSCSCDDGGGCGCTTGGAGKGVVGMRKDGELVGSAGGDVATMEPPDEGMLLAGTIEIPAAPKKYGYSDLIRAAMDLGFAEAEATAVAQLIRQDFGNPEDPEELLIPDGSSPEGMIAAAAIHGGLAMPQGAQVAPEVEAEAKRFKFTSKPGEVSKAPFGSYWRRLTRRFLGLDRPASEHEKLAEEVKELKTEGAKTKSDLMEIMRMQYRLLAHALKVPAEALDTPAEGEEAILPAAAGGLAPGVTGAIPGKAVTAEKCGPVAAKGSPEDVMAGITRVLAEAGWSAPGAKVEATQPVATVVPIGEPVGPAVPVQEPVEFDPDSVGERVMDPATAPDYSGIPDVPAAEKILPAARKSMAAVAEAPANGGGKRYSSTIGIWLSAADRRAAGWKRGV